MWISKSVRRPVLSSPWRWWRSILVMASEACFGPLGLRTKNHQITIAGSGALPILAWVLFVGYRSHCRFLSLIVGAGYTASARRSQLPPVPRKKWTTYKNNAGIPLIMRTGGTGLSWARQRPARPRRDTGANRGFRHQVLLLPGRRAPRHHQPPLRWNKRRKKLSKRRRRRLSAFLRHHKGGGVFEPAEANVYRLAESQRADRRPNVSARGFPSHAEYGGLSQTAPLACAQVARYLLSSRSNRPATASALGTYRLWAPRLPQVRSRCFRARIMLDLVVADGHANASSSGTW